MKLLLFILVILVNSADCQIIYTYNTWGDLFKKPEITDRDYEVANTNLKLAFDAFNEGNMTKTKFFLKFSKKRGIVSAQYYLILGKYRYKMSKPNMAAKAWLKGFRKHGCWECGELRDEMFVKKRERWDELKR